MLSPTSKHIRHLKQCVTITGLGLDDFQSQLDMIPDIVALFTRAVNEDRIEPHSIIGELKELSTLHASNRYFTPKKAAPNAKKLTFHRDVDPFGNLARLLGPAHVHIEENVVSYYECVGNTKYVNIKPASISVGDLVELQVSFIMVPLRENKFKATMVLHSILVLERMFTQVRKSSNCHLNDTESATTFRKQWPCVLRGRFPKIWERKLGP